VCVHEPDLDIWTGSEQGTPTQQESGIVFTSAGKRTISDEVSMDRVDNYWSDLECGGLDFNSANSNSPIPWTGVSGVSELIAKQTYTGH
jgi:hypothetical protein